MMRNTKDPFSFDESDILRKSSQGSSSKHRSRNEVTDASFEQQPCEPASRDELETPRVCVEDPAEDLAEKIKEVGEIAIEVDEDWRNAANVSFGSDVTEYIGDLAVATPRREMESEGDQSDLQSEPTEPEGERCANGITSSDETGTVQIEPEDDERQFEDSVLNMSDPDEASYWYADIREESSVRDQARQAEVRFYHFFLLMILRQLFGWMPGMNDIARDLFVTRPMITQGRSKEDEKEKKKTMKLRRLESREDGKLEVVPELKDHFAGIDE